MSRILGVYAAFRRCPAPIIAVVQGKALGFGCALVGGADIAIASRDATFALTEMPHGTAPTLALSALSHAAPKTLMDMVLTVEEHDAEHALAAGIVSRIVDQSELEPTVARILDTLGGFDRTNISTCKRFIQRGLNSTRIRCPISLATRWRRCDRADALHPPERPTCIDRLPVWGPDRRTLPRSPNARFIRRAVSAEHIVAMWKATKSRHDVPVSRPTCNAALDVRVPLLGRRIADIVQQPDTSILLSGDFGVMKRMVQPDPLDRV